MPGDKAPGVQQKVSGNKTTGLQVACEKTCCPADSNANQLKMSAFGY
jgi:hypothetical protein